MRIALMGADRADFFFGGAVGATSIACQDHQRRFGFDQRDPQDRR
jgi:hypothetical protein